MTPSRLRWRPCDACGDVETVPIGRSAGRIAAGDVAASIPLPPFDQSAVDGYGIRADDLDRPTTKAFRRPGRPSQARSQPAPPERGEVVRLLTGAPVPHDVEAVVMEEKVQYLRADVRLRPSAERGMNIRRRGEDVGAGSTILAAGTVIDARHVAILAASGISKISVRRRIAVGILSTGNELVAAGHTLGTHQIHDSNGPMLAALLDAPALRITPLGRCRDDRGRLEPAARADGALLRSPRLLRRGLRKRRGPHRRRGS